MAKKILIEYVNIGGKEQGYKSFYDENSLMEFPLTEDINLEVSSEFASMTENIPLLEQISDLMTTVSSLGGSASQGFLDFQNLSNIQRWKRTNPIRINTNLLFYTKTSAYEDVYKPMVDLMSITILTQDPKNPKKYRTPGLNLSSTKQAKKDAQKKQTSNISSSFESGSKLIAFRIPGVIYLPLALITKAIPTVSKEETDSGYPLWATMNLEITGLYPATNDLLKLENTSFGFLGSISQSSDFTTLEEQRELGQSLLNKQAPPAAPTG